MRKDVPIGAFSATLENELCTRMVNVTEMMEKGDNSLFESKPIVAAESSEVGMPATIEHAQAVETDKGALSGKSPESPESPKSPSSVSGDNDNIGNNSGGTGEIGEIGESGESGEDSLPTFSDSVTDKLPEFLKKVASYGRDAKEKDIMLLSAITVISGCLPNVQGVYDDRIVYANLFFFLSARAGSGKGRVELCRRIALPIHERLRSKYASLHKAYIINKINWENTPKALRGSMPVKPAQTMLYIPADTSATAFIQLLNENEERGIIFDTEADGLSASFESDFGDYSKTLRVAFHHEGTSYHRRGNDEDVEVKSPKLSVVLTGTPKQGVRLIRNAENGLFSRFMFYRLESDLRWRSVLGNQSKVTLEDKFNELGDEFSKYYDTLCLQPKIHFSVTEEQYKAFDMFFSKLLIKYYHLFKEDIVGSVFRLGLICYRIAMVLSAIRMMETGKFTTELICTGEDFRTAINIIHTLAVHMTRIFDEMSAKNNTRSAALAKSAKRQKFYSALPEEFGRKEYIDAANKVGVPVKTAEKWISRFSKNDGPLERVEQGRYKKKR